MISPVTTVGFLTSLGLLAPKGLAIALEGVDTLSSIDQFDLERVFRPLVRDWPGVSLPARKLSGGLALEKWRATAQQLKHVPAETFFAAVEKSYAQGAAWLYDLENLEETESARLLYEKHRPQLEDRRDLEDPAHRFARKGVSSQQDPCSKMWIQWVSSLSRSPVALVEETLETLKESLKDFPGSESMLRDLRDRLALNLRDSDAMSEKKKVFRFAKRIAFISEAYLEVLEGRPVRGLLFRTFEFLLKLMTMRVLEKELQEHRSALRGVSGEERLRLVADWKRQFSPALDDFEIHLRTEKILLPKIDQGNGRLETVRVEATDEEILNALPLSHRGILRTLIRVLDEAKNKMGVRFLTDSGEVFFLKVSMRGEKAKANAEQLAAKISLIQAELFRAESHGDIRFRKPAWIIKHVSDIYPFWVEETARLLGKGETDPRLEKALIRWRYYFYILLPDDVKDPAQFDRMNRGLSSLSKRIHKTHVGRRIFVSRHLVELLAVEELLSAEEFVRRLENLPIGENYYASLYANGNAAGVREETEEETARRTQREERQRLRAEIAAERQLAREQDVTATRVRLIEEQRVREEELAALEAVRLEATAAVRVVREAEVAKTAQVRQEEEELRRRESYRNVIVAQEDVLISLLSEIKIGNDPTSLKAFRKPEELLAAYAKICAEMESAMNLSLAVQHAVDNYAKAAKALVEEVRRMKREWQKTRNEADIG